ncbi:hypothetical protein [Photobacterium swingsii]|uniref:hypothetical protein n=1 Tax=Photobacterium swingsii TaxID=680026 RepID=UPI003D15087C
MKQRYHRLSVVTASIIAALALSGCNDDDSSNNGSDAKQAKAAMHTVFDGFTSEIKKIDDTPLGRLPIRWRSYAKNKISSLLLN